MGRSAPNPPVACVVVDVVGGRLRLFSGSTEPPGRRHAEIVALDALKADRAALVVTRATPLTSGTTALPVGRVLFVTLEPCSRQGRTPPCTTRITADPALRTLVYGALDPTLSGEGVSILSEHGVSVRSGVLEHRLARAFLGGFLNRSAGKGPRLHLKAAATWDGVMANPPGSPRLRISNPAGLAFGMLLRAKLDAVVVGPGTVATDLPSLAFRAPGASLLDEWQRQSGRDLLCDLWLQHHSAALALAEADASYQPLRIVLLGRDFPDSGIFCQRQEDLARSTGKPVVFVALDGGDFSQRARALRRVPDREPTDQPHTLWERLPALIDPHFGRELRALLGRLGCNEVLVEGGPRLHSVLRAELHGGDRVLLLRQLPPEAETGTPSSVPVDAGAPPPEHVRAAGVLVPAFFTEGEANAVYRIGTDQLEVREQV